MPDRVVALVWVFAFENDVYERWFVRVVLDGTRRSIVRLELRWDASGVVPSPAGLSVAMLDASSL